MAEIYYFDGIKNKESFTRQELLESFRMGGFELGNAAFCKKIESMIKEGLLIRAGRNLYCIPQGNKSAYSHKYSELAVEVAGLLKENYPLLDFSILELIRLNDFVNHQLAHNTLFLSIEADIMDFVFDTLKEQYPGKVLINPTAEIYHQYWSDNMIVIVKLTTEAPKGMVEPWHTRLEKLLVDIISEQLISEAVSKSEYPNIYEDAFARYIVDEGCMFRYAKRRGTDKKIRKFIKEKTAIILNTKR